MVMMSRNLEMTDGNDVDARIIKIMKELIIILHHSLSIYLPTTYTYVYIYQPTLRIDMVQVHRSVQPLEQSYLVMIYMHDGGRVYPVFNDQSEEEFLLSLVDGGIVY